MSCPHYISNVSSDICIGDVIVNSPTGLLFLFLIMACIFLGWYWIFNKTEEKQG